jgi:hypothetical protein
MRPILGRTTLLVATAACALAGLGPPAESVAATSCSPVVNPYEGTRYEGVDLRRIRATGVSCPRARQVTRRAHRKALRLVPRPNGILRFEWHGWAVRGDLQPSTDRYVAKRNAKRVRWVF